MKLKIILTDSIYFFLSNLHQIAMLCLPWLVAGGLVEYLVMAGSSASITDPTTQPMIVLGLFFNILVLPIYTAALIQLMARQAHHQRPGNKELLFEAFKVWQPFFLLYLLMFAIGSAIIFGTLMGLTVLSQIVGTGLIMALLNSGIGIALFFLLALWIWSRFSFSIFYLVLAGLSPTQALQKSLQVTKPHTRVILTCLVLVMVPLMTGVMAAINFPPQTAAGHTMRVVIEIVGSFLLQFVNVVLFRIYMAITQEEKTNPPENPA